MPFTSGLQNWLLCTDPAGEGKLKGKNKGKSKGKGKGKGKEAKWRSSLFPLCRCYGCLWAVNTSKFQPFSLGGWLPP